MSDDAPGPMEAHCRSVRDGTPAARVDLPADFFVALIRRRGDVTALVTHLLGRPVQARLLSERIIPRVRPPGLQRLRTTGPFLHRRVRLDDTLPPHLPVAVVWALIVPWRLPEPVRVGLLGAEPLDRLLDWHTVGWTAEPVETQVHTVMDGSMEFPWAAPATPLVEQTRLLTTADAEPVATTIDEVPLLRAGADPASPLRRRHRCRVANAH